MEHDLNRFLMAIAHVLGMWDKEMLIPTPSRPLAVQREDGHWKLDERGYPIPSQELLMEYDYLCRIEEARQKDRRPFLSREEL